MTEEKIEQLENLCEVAITSLSDLKEKLDKLVEFKESQGGLSSNNMEMNKTVNVSENLDNFKKIKEVLPAAINEMVSLSKQIQLLYVKRVDMQAAPEVKAPEVKIKDNDI